MDLIALAEPEAAAKALGQYAEGVEGQVIHGRVEGVRLRVFCADRASYGTTLFRTTGSIPWLSELGALPLAPDEESVFAALGKPYVPPFWREPEHIGLNPPGGFCSGKSWPGLSITTPPTPTVRPPCARWPRPPSSEAMSTWSSPTTPSLRRMRGARAPAPARAVGRNRGPKRRTGPLPHPQGHRVGHPPGRLARLPRRGAAEVRCGDREYSLRVRPLL